MSQPSAKETRKFISTLLKTCAQAKVKGYDDIKSQVISDLNSFSKDISLIRSENNDTLGILAVIEDKIDTVRIIIDSYLHILGSTEQFFNWVFEYNKDKANVFDVAAERGNINIIQYLFVILSKTSEVRLELKEPKNNLFHFAAQHNQCYPIIFFYEKLQSYFKETLIIDTPNENGISPLLYACIKGSKQVMDLLLDLGVNINSVDKDGNTCLHYAVMSNSPRVVKKLLVRGANRELKNIKGQTPEMLARENKFDNIAEILEMKGFCRKCFLGADDVTAIKGNKNNLLMLFLIMFLLLLKLIYICNIGYIYIGDFKFDTFPFVIDITKAFSLYPRDTKEYNYTNYLSEFPKDKIENYKELFDNKCILSSDTNCAFEITIMGLSLTTDITMMFIIVPFLLCSMKHFYEKNIKKENPKSSRFIRRRKKCMCEM